MWALLQSSSLLLFRRRKHRVNCHILAAIQATFPTRLGCQFWFCSESKLSCHASGCKRFHDNWNGYCPQHPWSRWVKCTDVLKTAPRLREAEFGGQKIPNHARFVMRSHGCLWRLWLSTLRYTDFLLAFAAVPKGHFRYLDDPGIYMYRTHIYGCALHVPGPPPPPHPHGMVPTVLAATVVVLVLVLPSTSTT